MTPRRLDRLAIRARLSDVPGWIVEDLLDAFEPAALSAIAEVDARKKKTAPPKGAQRAQRRTSRPDADVEIEDET